MSDTQPPGWYKAQGDPPGTQRYWDGSRWQGGPQPVPGAGAVGAAAASVGTLAEPKQRILARLIDGALWFMIVSLLPTLLGASSGLLQVVLTIIGGIAVAAYEVLMVAQRGATLGKLALGLKVVDEDGAAPDQATALRRMYVFLPFIVVLAIPIVGAVAFVVVAAVSLVRMFNDERRQTLWDMVGRTLVVEG